MSRSILLVDDDTDYLEGMRLQLEAVGHQVACAETTKDAKAELDKRRPDVAVIDLMMDQPDAGFALCYHIKKLDPTIPVILVSAVHSETGLDFDATTPDEKSWVKADAILAKPVRVEQLTREIDRLLKE